MVFAPVGESSPGQVIGEHVHCQAVELVTAADFIGGNAARLPGDLNATGEQGQEHGINCGAGFGGVEEHGMTDGVE